MRRAGLCGGSQDGGVSKKMMDTVVGVHPSSAEELVTMRTPTRQVRDKALVPA